MSHPILAELLLAVSATVAIGQVTSTNVSARGTLDLRGTNDLAATGLEITVCGDGHAVISGSYDGGRLLVGRPDGGSRAMVHMQGGLLRLCEPGRKKGEVVDAVPRFDGAIVMHAPSFAVFDGWAPCGVLGGPITDGARLIVDIPDKMKPEALAGRKVVLATIAGTRTGEFSAVASANPDWTVEAAWAGTELQIVPRLRLAVGP